MTVDYAIRMLAVVMPPHKTVVKTSKKKVWGAMQKKVSLFLIFIVFIASGMPAMSYEEPQYKIVKKTDIYEVRRYAQRTVAQAKYDKEDSGFRILFG